MQLYDFVTGLVTTQVLSVKSVWCAGFQLPGIPIVSSPAYPSGAHFLHVATVVRMHRIRIGEIVERPKPVIRIVALKLHLPQDERNCSLGAHAHYSLIRGAHGHVNWRRGRSAFAMPLCHQLLEVCPILIRQHYMTDGSGPVAASYLGTERPKMRGP